VVGVLLTRVSASKKKYNFACVSPWRLPPFLPARKKLGSGFFSVEVAELRELATNVRSK
jgi:hypothetical protein